MPKASRQSQSLLIVLVVISVGLLASAARTWSEDQYGPEVIPSFTALVKFLNTAPEKRLAETPGISPVCLKKLMAHRTSAGPFKNFDEVALLCDIQRSELEKLLKPFQDLETQQRIDASRKEIPEPSAKPGSKAGAKQTVGEADPTAGPIGMVKPGYYSKLPGFEDLDKIDPLKKTEFLETVNREMCSCGCKGETVAFCLVNDPACPVVKARAKKIYDDIMTKAPR